jgi:hypothetical protein
VERARSGGSSNGRFGSPREDKRHSSHHLDLRWHLLELCHETSLLHHRTSSSTRSSIPCYSSVLPAQAPAPDIAPQPPGEPEVLHLLMLPRPCCYSLHIDSEVQLVELLHPLQQLVDSEVQLVKLLDPMQQLIDGSTVYFPAGKQDEFGFGSCFPHSVLFCSPIRDSI